MKHLLFRILVGFSLAAAILGPLLYGCRPTRPAPAPVAAADAAATAQVAADTTRARVEVLPPRTLVDKLLGRTPAPVAYTGASTIKAGKKSAITIFQGPATVTSTTTGKKGQSTTGEGATSTKVEKPAGAVATGAGNATDQRKATQAAATHGDGNTLGQTMPAPPPKRGFLAGLGAAVGAYVVPVIVVAALGAAVWFGWPVLLAWWRRRKQAQS